MVLSSLFCFVPCLLALAYVPFDAGREGLMERGRKRREGGGNGGERAEEKAGIELRTFSPLFFPGCWLVCKICSL